jgi:hypothetical protein
MDFAMSAQPADNVRILSESGRDPRGRFASVPANIGRPLGAKGQHNREMLRKVKELAPTALQKLSDALDRGERFAVEFVLNRVLPQSRTIDLEGATVDDVKAALQNGDISTVEAKEMSATLAKLNEISELSDLRARLEELEKLLLQQAR